MFKFSSYILKENVFYLINVFAHFSHVLDLLFIVHHAIPSWLTYLCKLDKYEICYGGYEWQIMSTQNMEETINGTYGDIVLPELHNHHSMNFLTFEIRLQWVRVWENGEKMRHNWSWQILESSVVGWYGRT